MSTHQFNREMLSDDHFIKGELKFLVVGNECRLLDQRRTPGVIESLDLDGGYFRWVISDFEDKGHSWDVAFERVTSYQFKKGSKETADEEINLFEARVKELDKRIDVSSNLKQQEETKNRILDISKNIEIWLSRNSKFFRSNEKINFQNMTGPQLLRDDFINYMDEKSLLHLEEKTSKIQVMNPYSGDWVRGLQIVMAEIGIKDYSGPAPRSKNTFVGVGEKRRRQQYIENRLAFLRSYFRALGISEVPVYRGMVTEWDWSGGAKENYRYWSSWTFNHQVSQDFTSFDPSSKFKNSYLVRRAFPVEKLFMTYLETDAMNKQYLEAEALVLHSDEDRLLW